MPTYEYRCEAGHRFEEFQSILAEPIRVCPVCGAKAERLISGGTGLIFKGTGFYITDYARKDSGGGVGEAERRRKSESPATTAPAESTAHSEPPAAPSTGKKDD
ncbi:MAG: zinc ribbon domain-containing protein [bacterium]|nr:zinc ribbon domain-containing protein [bacterium]